jgi:hypothetical protein
VPSVIGQRTQHSALFGIEAHYSVAGVVKRTLHTTVVNVTKAQNLRNSPKSLLLGARHADEPDAAVGSPFSLMTTAQLLNCA